MVTMVIIIFRFRIWPAMICLLLCSSEGPGNPRKLSSSNSAFMLKCNITISWLAALESRVANADSAYNILPLGMVTCRCSNPRPSHPQSHFTLSFNSCLWSGLNQDSLCSTGNILHIHDYIIEMEYYQSLCFCTIRYTWLEINLNISLR